MLVVDDVEANLVSIAAVLEGLDCDVMRARSGDEALRLLLDSRFAVVLLDVQMPRMDGYEVASYIRSNPATRDVPVIFLTAIHDTPESELRGYDTGAVDFLFKPIATSILRGKVRVFIDLARTRAALSSANDALESRNQELRRLASERAALAESFRLANEDLRRTNRELKETQAQLIQSEKMASLGKLVAGIAHEINNPLAFAMSHLDTSRRALAEVESVLLERFTDGTRASWRLAHDRLEGMALGLTRIQDLVTKLRTFSRLDEGERTQVRVSESVQAVLAIVQHRLNDETELSVECGQPDVIECYPALLNQALMNLVTNAIDAVGEGGGPGRVAVRTGREHGRYAIKVIDNGVGIPESLRNRVVEPFFTTKPVGSGTGLGLSITYSIVEKHGGTLELTDAVGGGTEAILRIPLTRARPEDAHDT